MSRRMNRDRRRTAWSGQSGERVTVSSGATVVGPGLAPNAIDPIKEVTLTRTRCEINVLFADDAGPQDAQLFAIGLAVVSTDAATLGATAMPDPFDEPGFPWVWYCSSVLTRSGTASTDSKPEDAWGLSARHYDVDSKAQRVIRPSETLIWVIQTANVVGNESLFVDFGTQRYLFKLP